MKGAAKKNVNEVDGINSVLVDVEMLELVVHTTCNQHGSKLSIVEVWSVALARINRYGVPLGLVQNQPTGKIKSLGKYLFSRHPKHTIGICSLRYIQIQGA